MLTTDALHHAEDVVHQDLIGICLAASYLTGLSATISREAPMSEMMMLQKCQHFPRVRAMGEGEPAIRDHAEFVARVEAFANGFAETSRTEKSRLLIHHWIDALECWSFEDLVLGVTTILEIIAATSETIAGLSKEDQHAVSLKRLRHGAEYPNWAQTFETCATILSTAALCRRRPSQTRRERIARLRSPKRSTGSISISTPLIG